MQGKNEAWGTKIVEGRIIGRDNKIVPPQEVEDLAALGCKNHEICDWFGINKTTLIRNFETELTKGRENLKQSLRRAQIAAAMSGNVVMLIWLGKNILGQRDNNYDAVENSPLPWTSSTTDSEVEEIKEENTDEIARD
jgi:hypothetical protein